MYGAMTDGQHSIPVTRNALFNVLKK